MSSSIQKKTSKIPLKAIALAYDNPDCLPQVLASGNNELARLIIEIAKNAEIPITENRELVSLLDQQREASIVSSKTLKVLAEVIAFLYHTDSLWKKNHSKLTAFLE